VTHAFVSALVSALFAGLALSACATAPAQPETSDAEPGCIMVVQGVVTDREAFPAYARALPPLYARFGGTYLVVARNPETLEGDPPFESLVISHWPNCDAARAFWTSEEYRALQIMRAEWGRFDVVIAPAMPSGVTAAPMARSNP
jgi:uncharacterized protein (DUF1330 family)